MLAFLPSEKRWRGWARCSVARDLLFRTRIELHRAVRLSEEAELERRGFIFSRLFMMHGGNDLISKRNPFAFVGFDARDREDEENYFGSLCGLIFVEKSQKWCRRKREKIHFLFFRVWSFYRSGCIFVKLQATGEISHRCSQNWMLDKRCKFHSNQRILSYGVVNIPWIHTSINSSLRSPLPPARWLVANGVVLPLMTYQRGHAQNTVYYSSNLSSIHLYEWKLKRRFRHLRKKISGYFPLKRNASVFTPTSLSHIVLGTTAFLAITFSISNRLTTDSR